MTPPTSSWCGCLRRQALAAALLVLAFAAGVVFPIEHGSTKGNATRIVTGPGIERPLEIPFPDGWLEWDERYDGSITPLATPPLAVGDPVIVWSEAWITALPGRAIDEVPKEVDPFDGRYWPEVGVVAVDDIGGVAWYELDPERRDVLDRYIRLARLGVLSESPTPISVALAGWRHLGEPLPFDVRVAHEPLSASDAEGFLAQLAAADTRDVLPSEFDPAATNFGPWDGHVWPLDTTGSGRDVLVQFCPPEESCEGWRLMANQGLLVDDEPGMPSWPAFVLPPESQRFIEERAAAVYEARGGAPAPPEVLSSSTIQQDSSRPVPLSVVAVALAVVGLAGAGVVVRSRRVRFGPHD